MLCLMRRGVGSKLGLVLPSAALGRIGGLAHGGRTGAWGTGLLSRCGWHLAGPRGRRPGEGWRPGGARLWASRVRGPLDETLNWGVL